MRSVEAYEQHPTASNEQDVRFAYKRASITIEKEHNKAIVPLQEELSRYRLEHSYRVEALQRQLDKCDALFLRDGQTESVPPEILPKITTEYRVARNALQEKIKAQEASHRERVAPIEEKIKQLIEKAEAEQQRLDKWFDLTGLTSKDEVDKR